MDKKVYEKPELIVYEDFVSATGSIQNSNAP